MNKSKNTVQTINEIAIKEKISFLMNKTEIKFNENQIDQLTQLVALLVFWNSSLNLTAIKDPEEMVVLHILDSAVIAPYLVGKNIADVGTGAGFPGLVLAILRPDLQFTLIDSIAKKLSFVRTAMVKLKLDNVKIINKRCEDIVAEPKFDCIVNRAFAPLNKIIQWCSHLLDSKGTFLAMKANLTDEELKEIPNSVKIDEIINLEVPGLDAKRQIVKMSHTII